MHYDRHMALQRFSQADDIAACFLYIVSQCLQKFLQVPVLIPGECVPGDSVLLPFQGCSQLFCYSGGSPVLQHMGGLL